MLKNLAILAFSVISLASLVGASSAQAAETLCPRYRCSAEPTQASTYDNFAGFGYGDELAIAQEKAVRDCSEENKGSACSVAYCEKYKGPILAIFSSCKSQW